MTDSLYLFLFSDAFATSNATGCDSSTRTCMHPESSLLPLSASATWGSSPVRVPDVYLCVPVPKGFAPWRIPVYFNRCEMGLKAS